jgi:hypothetical protein
LLLHFGGFALGADHLAGLVFLETHDAHKLFSTFGADVFIGGHGTPPDYRGNNSITIEIIMGSPGYCKGCQRQKKVYRKNILRERGRGPKAERPWTRRQKFA